MNHQCYGWRDMRRGSCPVHGGYEYFNYFNKCPKCLELEGRCPHCGKRLNADGTAFEPPKVGEIWTVGHRDGIKYLGIARDFYEEKYLVFDDHGTLFVIKKDEFYAEHLLTMKEA
jgi:hypothetical protein